MESNNSMDEVIRNLDKTSAEEQQKMGDISAKLDRITDLTKELGLDILTIVRDAKTGAMALVSKRNSSKEDEDAYSVARGLLIALNKGVIEESRLLVLPVLQSVAGVPGVEFKIDPKLFIKYLDEQGQDN